MRAAGRTNSCRQHCIVVTLLLLSILAPTTHCQRIIVKHSPDAAAAVVEQASKLKLLPVAQTPGFTVLRNQGKTQLKSDKIDGLLERAQSWPGVQFAEQDLPRYMHLPAVEEQQARNNAGAAAQQEQQQANCKDKSVPLSDSPVPEYQVSSAVVLLLQQVSPLSRVPHASQQQQQQQKSPCHLTLYMIRSKISCNVPGCNSRTITYMLMG
jgi:hypothetical protein